MVRFIADIGSNHNQDLKRGIQIIRQCAAVGFWGVKFQLFRAEKLYADGFGSIQKLKRNELLDEHISPFLLEAHKNGLMFGCTPFDLESAEKIVPYCDFIKISSFDILRTDLIRKCIVTGKETILSLGLCMDIPKVCFGQNNVSLLHCISKYPCEPEDACLTRISDLKKQFYHVNTQIGYSDHTTSPGVIYEAVSLGAKIIEVHVDLNDLAGNESFNGHCWTIDEISNVIADVQVMSLSVLKNFKLKNDELLMCADPTDGLRPMKKARERK